MATLRLSGGLVWGSSPKKNLRAGESIPTVAASLTAVASLLEASSSEMDDRGDLDLDGSSIHEHAADGPYEGGAGRNEQGQVEPR